MTITRGVTITATPGELSNLQVEPEGFRVRDLVAYSFSFVTANRVFKDGTINIVVPAQITVSAALLSLTPVTTITEDGSASLSFDASTNSISITNAFPQDYNTPQLIEFVINTGLKNAESTEPIAPFTIQTLDSLGAVIDAGKSTALTFTPNEITSILTQACSNKKTASETEDICTYKLTFQIGAQYPIMTGSTIEIDLPDDLSLFDYDDTEQESGTSGIADLSAQFEVKNDGRTIEVQDAFIVGSSPNGKDYRQDSFAVEIAGVVSPRTTAPTLSFKARIRSSEGYLQYTRQQGVYSNVYQARAFKTVVIKRTNETNGDDSGTYNFTLQFSSVVNQNEYIKITPPENVIINPGGAGQCTGTRLLAKSLACSILDGSLYVLIDPLDEDSTSFNSSDIVMFQVSDIRNPLSLEPTDSFNIYVATSTSQDYYVNQMVQGLSLLNTYMGELTDVRVLPDTNQFSTVTDYSIYFVTANLMDQFSYIRITFPADFYSFTSNLQKCTAIKNIEQTLVCTPSDGNVITITKGYTAGALLAGSEVGIRLLNVANPSQSVSVEEINQNFRIETMTVDDYGIDMSYYLNFSIGCSYPCESCDNLQTICTSCQKLNDDTPLYLYESTCNVECPVGTYANADNECLACDPLCKRCSESPDKCDSCREELGYPYVTQQGTCTAKCTDGTYLNYSAKSCQDCEGNCDTCSSAIECLSCQQGYYFIEGQCLSTCPSNSIMFDSVEVQECLKCDDPCASCVETVDHCTSCSPSTFLMGTSCVDKCPATYLPDDNNVCYKASEQTYPFISLIMPGFIIVLILISFCLTRETKPFVLFLGLESCAMVVFWIYMLVFLVRDGHQASATLVSLALFANWVINYLWWEYYNDKLYKNDIPFQEFDALYPKTTKAIKILCLLINFDLFRISYSYMFDLPQLKADMLKKDKNYKRINRYELFQITFCYMLTLVAACFNLFYTWYGRQIFWIDIECISLGTVIVIYKLVIIFKSEKNYINKVLHPSVKPKRVKVQSAGVDDDDDDIQNGQGLDSKFLDKKALKVARAIEDTNVNSETRAQIKGLTHEQRMLAAKAVFYKLITGKKLGQQVSNDFEMEQLDQDKYLLKHGGQLEQLEKEKAKQKYKTHQQSTKLIKDNNYQEVAGDTLGQTQTQEINTTENMFDDGVAPLQTMQLRQEDLDFDDSNIDSQRMYNDKELVNFQSAPLNAQSALQGNKDLELRHKKLQEELKNRNNPLFSNRLLKTKNLKDLDLDTDKIAQTKYNKTLASKVLANLPQDSDDQIENFTSEKWGPGASKVVAEHYNTTQAKKEKTRTPRKGDQTKDWSKADKSTIPQGTLQTTKLTQQQFQEKIEEVKTQQMAKRLAKEKAFEFSESSKKLDKQLTAQQVENKKLRDFIKALELQIAGEEGRLNGVRQTKKEELDFAENAFYTSNEDGMGVSPNHFISQNRVAPVKPSHKPQESRETKEMPANDEQIILEDQILRSVTLEDQVLRSVTPKSQLNSGRADLEKSRISQSGTKSISASEIKAMVAVRDSRNKIGIEDNQFSSDSETEEKKKSFLLVESSGHEAVPPSSSGDNLQRKPPLETSGTRKKQRGNSKRQKSMANPTDTDGNLVSSSGDHKNLLKSTPQVDSQSENRGIKETVGRVTRKPHTGQRSFSGLKASDEPDSKSQKELKYKPLNSERDKFEYYTSEDEFGLPVNKLRKKGQRQKSKPVGKREGTGDDDLEFYSTVDGQGKRVQKLRKKGGSKSQGRTSQNQQVKKQGDFNFRPDFKELEQSTIKGSVMGATGENFTKFSLVSSRGNLTSAHEQQAAKGRSRSNNAPLQPIVSQRPPTDHAQDRDGTMSQLTAHRAATVTVERNQQTSALRDAGITVIKTSGAKSKSKNRKKVSAPARDFSGPYFNHTNFEKAVIATNGRAPYNNKEVEVISKKDKFDPKDFNFQNKNNWVNQTLVDVGKVGAGPVSAAGAQIVGSAMSAASPRNRRHDRSLHDIASASVTATTVFQGLNNQSAFMGSVQQTDAKPTKGMSNTQQQFGFGGSPVTLRGNGGGQDAGTTEGGGGLGMSPMGMGSNESSPEAKGGNLMYEQAQSYLQRNPSRE